VVFDLDGTLVDTEALHLAASHHAARAVLGRDVSAEVARASLGRPLPLSMAVIAGGAGDGPGDRAEVDTMVPALMDAFLAFYGAHQAAMVRPFPGVPAVLAELRRRGYPLALLSNKLRAWGRAELEDVGLAPLLDVVVFMEDMPEPKPAAAALDPVLAALALAADRILLIGDGAADVGCARAAGATAAVALWGTAGREPAARESLLALGAARTFEHPSDVLTYCP
jgi:HAD superfamily hydrolase (TIGR01509 family)